MQEADQTAGAAEAPGQRVAVPPAAVVDSRAEEGTEELVRVLLKELAQTGRY
jgi:hypothetical protein